MKKLDKYEYNLKLEEIDKLVDQSDYTEAANLADTIDWRRVRNVRTLCLISEIYEAAGRLEDSKTLLVRAYRRSPVGRTVLYRLVEVTTALQQYDEAIEYYTEYVQAAPHDNNRYILKYKIYKGRGSSIEELIAILEEYLGQEYTERWAYELATLYQQSGQMQKCLAACDDLVLWFHSGKYVVKALELKKRYAALTPKQQQIYEESIQEKMDDYLDEEEPEEETVIQPQPSAEIDGDVLAESIMAQTEKEIATQVAAHKAEMEKQAAGESAADAEASKEEPSSETQQKADEEAENGAPEDTQDIQVELAKSMRKIISGVVKRIDETEEDVPASVDASLQNPQKIVMPEAPEQVAGQLSIDDVLLSMSDQGKKVTDAVLQADEDEHPEKEEKAETPEESTADKPLDVQTIPVPERGKSVTEAATDELTKAQREALQYTNHPEKLLRNKKAVPTYTEEKPADEDDLGKTRRIVNTKEELMEAAKKEILAEKTIRIPTEEISRKIQEEPLRQETQDEAPEYDEAVSDVEEIDGVQEAEAEMYPEETYEENDSYGEDGYDDYEEEYEDIRYVDAEDEDRGDEIEE